MCVCVESDRKLWAPHTKNHTQKSIGADIEFSMLTLCPMTLHRTNTTQLITTLFKSDGYMSPATYGQRVEYWVFVLSNKRMQNVDRHTECFSHMMWRVLFHQLYFIEYWTDFMWAELKSWFTITLVRLEALYTFLWKICPFCRSFGISRDLNHPVANAQKYHSGTGHFIICFLVGVGHFHVFEFIQYAHAVKNVTLFSVPIEPKNSRLKKVTQIDTIIHIRITIDSEMVVRVQDGTSRKKSVQSWKLIVSKRSIGQFSLHLIVWMGINNGHFLALTI